MVVVIHADLLEAVMNGVNWIEPGRYPVFELVSHIISGNVARICVPLFFFISGFLFFSRADFAEVKYLPDTSFFIGKFRRRIHTLLIPYIFWNIAAFAIIIAEHLFLQDMMRGNDKPLGDYTFIDWLGIFWDNKVGVPANQPLWFMRDLMVINLFSPLIFVLIRRLRALPVVVLGILWTLNIWFDYTVGISVVGFFYYSFGAFFSIRGKDFLDTFIPYRKISAAAFLILVIADAVLWKTGYLSSLEEVEYGATAALRFDIEDVVYNLGILAGSVAILAWSGFGIKKGALHASTFLASTSFFIYAYHGKVIAFLNRIVIRHLNPMNDLTLMISYILIPTLVVALGIGLYVILKRYMPRFTNIITGGR